MEAKEIIPVKKEVSFVFKLVLVMIASAALALLILYFFLDKDVGGSYSGAFKLMSDTYKHLNFYIITALLVQLLLSSIVVFVVAMLFSHKIAGPIYRLKIFLLRYINGEKIQSVSFRNTDFIPGVSRSFSDFFLFINKRETLLDEAQLLIKQLQQAGEQEVSSLKERLVAILLELEASRST